MLEKAGSTARQQSTLSRSYADTDITTGDGRPNPPCSPCRCPEGVRPTGASGVGVPVTRACARSRLSLQGESHHHLILITRSGCEVSKSMLS